MIQAPRPAAEFTREDTLLCDASKVILPLAQLDPINAAEERDKVGRDWKYNPSFRYGPIDRPRLLAILEEIEKIELPSEGVGVFLQQSHDYIHARLKLLLALGEDPAWADLSRIYPLPPPRVISLARGVLSSPLRSDPDLPRPFGAEDQASLMRSRLAQYGLHDWQVIVRPNISSTHTDSSNRKVYLRAETSCTTEEVKRLIVHEVDTHVLRAANGYGQPYRIFAVGAVPSYLMTEEGLAVVNEERMGYIDGRRRRIFAGRVVAAVRAHTSSFSEVYTELRDYGFPHDEAFVTATRVKRGLTDTANPGGFIKDHVYLWGRILVEDYVLRGGDLSRLYVGKIALEHVGIIRQLGLRPARYLPIPTL